jgi:hypothetical protein
MVVDHAAGERTTPLFVLTGNGGWPMTGAHGFVLISGAIMGIFYGGLIRASGFRAVLPRIGTRAAKLYVVAIVLGVLELASGLLADLGRPGMFDLEALMSLLTLSGASDALMTFYLTLLAIGLFVLLLLSRRLVALVVALSVGAWLVHQYDSSLLNTPLQPFAPLADWQLLFVAGMVMGHERERIASWLVGWRRRAYLIALFATLAFFLVVQVTLVNGLISWAEPPDILVTVAEQGWTDYDRNPPLHMLALFAYMLGIFHLLDWLWVPVRTFVGWFFIPLGQAALYVYAVHTVLVYYVLAGVALFQELNGPVLALSLLALMGLLWVMVRRRFLFAIIPR